jgi:hypothetical protein
VVDEHWIRRLRLQLQLAGMELSTSLQGDVNMGAQWSPLLSGQEVLPLLHHPCTGVRVVVFRYVSCVQFLAEVGHGDGSDSSTAFHTALLLAIQSALLPHQPALLSSAALRALSALVSSSTAQCRLELLSHPWHTFVVQSALFVLSQADVSLRSTWASAGRLLRYFHLLNGEPHCDTAVGERCKEGHAGERCVARLHLAAVDSRLLLPLLSFLPLGSGAHREEDVCVSSVGHFVDTLLHLHHAGCLPLSAASTVTPRLLQLQSIVEESIRVMPGRSPCCPASISRAPYAEPSTGSPPSQPHLSYSQLSPSQGSADSPSAPLQRTSNGRGEEKDGAAPEVGEKDVGLCQCEERGAGKDEVSDVRQLRCSVTLRISELLRLLKR